MLGEKDKETLRGFRLLGLFQPCEVELIDFIAKHRRTPHYKSELKQYRTLLRLKKKLSKSSRESLVLATLFEIINKLKVSNKSTGGGVS